MKVNVVKQRCILSDSVHDFGDLDFVNVDIGEEGFQYVIGDYEDGGRIFRKCK